MFDGAHGHGGGGGGAHSHGTGSGAAPPLGAALVGSAILFAAITSALWVGQHVYEATHPPIHILLVAGDWGSLFINVGLAAILGAVGAIVVSGSAVGRNRSGIVTGCLMLTAAAVCGLILAPHFEAKVIERSPADPARFRSPAAVRQLLPKRVTLRCVDCRGGRVVDVDNVSLRLEGMPIATYKRLCGYGYSDEWSSAKRPLMATPEQTVDQGHADSCLDYNQPYEKLMQVGATVPQRSGPWKITWRLRDPTGTVVRSSTAALVIKGGLNER